MNGRPNMEGLRRHEADVAARTHRAADDAIDAMIARGEKITFASVSKASGLSRSTLYANVLISERIRALRALQATSRASKPDGYESKMRRMSEKVKRLEAEKELLVAQVVELDLLRKENAELRRRLSARESRR